MATSAPLERGRRPDLRLGVDVGGTNTDAVILDLGGRLVAKAKVPTTPDIGSGIVAAVDQVLARTPVETSRITHAMIGSTHATNAVVERRGLQRVAVLRIGAPATLAVPPLAGWPPDLRVAVSAGEAIVGGGIELDGREFAPFDAEATARFLEPLAGKVDGIAIVSVFASVSPVHELAAERVVRDVLGDIPVSLSHEFGTIGLLERENATVLNAALEGVVRRVAGELGRALRARSLAPSIYFAQNDGTLMALEYALRHPVLTIGSGPANSLRGAAHLTGVGDALVVDIGGTSTDVGALVNGFPRESTMPFRVGGVDTNFRMPDLVSIGLGGGSIVRGRGAAMEVGPGSVGYLLPLRALVFGGQTPTLTDAAVWAGRLDLGDRASTLPRGRTLARALEISDARFCDVVDRVKMAARDLPLIAVGGGSRLLPVRIPGVSEIHRPDHMEVANAIGAAMAAVGGHVDRIVRFAPRGRDVALREAGEAARERAIQAGADPERTEVVDIEEIPLTYLTEPAVRIRVRASGPLSAQ